MGLRKLWHCQDTHSRLEFTQAADLDNMPRFWLEVDNIRGYVNWSPISRTWIAAFSPYFSQYSPPPDQQLGGYWDLNDALAAVESALMEKLDPLRQLSLLADED